MLQEGRDEETTHRGGGEMTCGGGSSGSVSGLFCHYMEKLWDRKKGHLEKGGHQLEGISKNYE